MNCPDISELECFVTQGLSDPDAHSVQEHLSSCDPCRTLTDEVRRNLSLAQSVRRVLNDRSTVTLPSFTTAPPAVRGFRVLREIGRGGMGVVYEAEQNSPRRRVALKILDAFRPLAQTERLFEREVRALARLRHSGIAAIFETGRADDGRSYFAMELVEGGGLRDFLNQRGDWSIRQRVRLFRDICDAIAYAHQRGVLHRDIKPGNIVVVAREPAAAPQPKILDFGLARILDTEDDSAATMMTEVGRVQGTLPYMSPEQARGETGEIDMRSDVYSLGVLLYEMLCGRLPLKLDPARLLESVRIISETAPTRPAAYNPLLDRDIETILLKTLEKQPERRYPTAAALRDDIDRYLSDRPIEARPPTLGYQLSKLIARHRIAAGLIAALFLLIASFGPAMMILYQSAEQQRANAEEQARIARKQTHRAEEQGRAAAEHAAHAELAKSAAELQARVSRRVTDFLVNSFTLADPDLSGGETLTARELLDRGMDRLQRELTEEPLERAALLGAIGSAYRGLGINERAAPLLEEAVRLREPLAESDPLALADALENLAQVRSIAGKLDEAETNLRRAMAIRRESLPQDARPLAMTLVNLADTVARRGRVAEAEPLFEEAMQLFDRISGPPTIQYASALTALGNLRSSQGRLPEAENYLRRAVHLLKNDLRSHRVMYAVAISNLANVIKDTGKLAEAETLLRESIDVRREIYGNESPVVATALNNYGRLLLDTGRAAEAEPLLRDGLEIRRRIDPHSLDAASSLENLGLTELERGRTDEAENLIRESLEIRRTALGDRHPRLANNFAMLGPILERKGEWIAAEDSYHEALSILRAAYGEEHPEIGRVMQRLGRNLGQQGRLDESEITLRHALDMQRRLLGVEHVNVGSIYGELGLVLLRREQPAEAAAYFRNQVDIYDKHLPPNHPRTSQGRLRLGQALLSAKEYEAAEDALQTVYEAVRDTPTLTVGETNLLDAAHNALIHLYETTEQHEQAKLLRNGSAQIP